VSFNLAVIFEARSTAVITELLPQACEAAIKPRYSPPHNPATPLHHIIKHNILAHHHRISSNTHHLDTHLITTVSSALLERTWYATCARPHHIITCIG
jgi:hypothetical protein